MAWPIRLFAFLSVLLAAACMACAAAQAVLPDEMLADPGLESRARSLSRELRCMVCQNQSIDDSEAPLARDLRILVRERLKVGDTDEQVLKYLTARYGNFVLLKPPLEWSTVLLWFGPAALLLAGMVALVTIARRREAMRRSGHGGEPGRLSPVEEARVASLLGQTASQEAAPEQRG
jgi:cytochrome c-type biogenesis protein CcmH